MRVAETFQCPYDGCKSFDKESSFRIHMGLVHKSRYPDGAKIARGEPLDLEGHKNSKSSNKASDSLNGNKPEKARQIIINLLRGNPERAIPKEEIWSALRNKGIVDKGHKLGIVMRLAMKGQEIERSKYGRTFKWNGPTTPQEQPTENSTVVASERDRFHAAAVKFHEMAGSLMNMLRDTLLGNGPSQTDDLALLIHERDRYRAAAQRLQEFCSSLTMMALDK